jgi:hypothetical protein
VALAPRAQSWRDPMRAFGVWDYCPWQHLGDLDGVELRYHQEGESGLFDFERRVISLRLDMSAAQRRTSLAHEIVHLERGPACAGAPAAVDELLVECTAALRLIPAPVLSRLPELVARHGQDAAASFLDVDEQLIRTALDVLEVSGTRGTSRGFR